ncbi:hypothetical protein GX50_04373 [[Emmonsia] crescens]|uniref:Uncharacterized protein n=1 Tax=[Emmonsia] crescens TaxID=73230 RepID=A0A2B7ZI39_9EURO|nr:hypothetical protein GX50_04373 [Emmonsia crescens]
MPSCLGKIRRRPLCAHRFSESKVAIDERIFLESGDVTMSAVEKSRFDQVWLALALTLSPNFGYGHKHQHCNYQLQLQQSPTPPSLNKTNCRFAARNSQNLQKSAGWALRVTLEQRKATQFAVSVRV